MMNADLWIIAAIVIPTGIIVWAGAINFVIVVIRNIRDML